MPIDPNIPLSGKAPQIESPVQAYGQVLSLKNMLQAQQLHSQQLQAATLENQARQKEQDSQAAFAKLLPKYTTPGASGIPVIDYGGIAKDMAASGFGKGAQDAITHGHADIQSRIKTATDTLTQNSKKAERVASLAGSITDDASKVKAVNQASAEGLLDQPGEAQRMLATPYEQLKPELDQLTAQGMNAVQQHAKAIADANLAREQNKDNREIAKNAPDLAEKWNKIAFNQAAIAGSQESLASVKANLKAQGAPAATLAQIPDAWTPDSQKQMKDLAITEEQRQTQARANAEFIDKKRHEGETEKIARQNNAISGARLGLAQKEFQLKTGGISLSGNQQKIAEQLASGDMSPTLVSRMPDKEALIAAAATINPEWAQSYPTKQAFTNPDKQQSKNLGTISRIVGHIGRFEHNSQNMGFAPAYALGMNRTGDQSVLNEDAHAISGELEKLVSGGVGSVGQTQEWQKSLHGASGSARQKAIDEISQLIGSQYEGMNKTYKAGIGQDLPLDKYVTPAGQAWMKSKGINVAGAAGGGAPAAATAATHVFNPATGQIEAK